MAESSDRRARARAAAIIAQGRQLAGAGPEGTAPEPMKRYVHPIPAPAERPAPPGPEALDRVLECLAGQNQLLVELLGAVNGLSAAVLSIRENLAEG